MKWKRDGGRQTCLNNNETEPKFPGNSVHFHYKGLVFNPWSGKIMKVMQHGQRKKKDSMSERKNLKMEETQRPTTILFDDDDDDGLSQCFIPDYVSENLLCF